jgi:hypothetical protein
LDSQSVAGKAETGEFMRSTMLDMDSRLRVATAVEKDETQASRSVFEILRRRGHPDAPPPTISDGWGGIDEAMLSIYGLTPEYSGRGRPPTRKKPGKDWLYLQMVKQRDEHGHFTGTKLKAIFGNQQELLQTRKTLAFSKELGNHRAAALWEDAYYNLVKHHKGLRLPAGHIPGRKWIQRTPMMAAGLADHAWTIYELLTTIPLKC